MKRMVIVIAVASLIVATSGVVAYELGQWKTNAPSVPVQDQNRQVGLEADQTAHPSRLPVATFHSLPLAQVSNPSPTASRTPSKGLIFSPIIISEDDPSDVDGVKWFEVVGGDVAWQDADGIYWKLYDCFTLPKCNDQEIMLSSKDGTTWQDATNKSWRGADGKRHRIKRLHPNTSDELLDVQESTDGGKTWKESYDGTWPGLDDHEYMFGTGESVWTRVP